MIDLLNDVDLQYICEIIPLKNAIAYFTKNSKEFTKLLKGFRAKSINNQQKKQLLFIGVKSCNRFVCDFVNKHIKDWLEQIADHIKLEIESIGDERRAIINTLVDSFFVNNIALYFKLAGLSETEEYIVAAQAGVLSLRDAKIETEKIEQRFVEFESEIEKLEKELENAIEESNSYSNRNAILNKELLAERRKLQSVTDELARLTNKLVEVKLSSNRQIVALLNDLKSSENKRQNLLTEINILKTEVVEKISKIEKLESSLEEANSLAQISVSISSSNNSMPMIPQDIDEFKEYLSYNLEAFGVKNGINLLSNHLTNILFTGKPIVLERNIAQQLAACISNTLKSGKKTKTLIYSPNLNFEMISKFLTCDDRILVFDNFLGNINETLLFPLFDKCKDKIILLGIAYEKALQYVADEFWTYVKYLNLWNTGGFQNMPQNMEDPSEFEEQTNEALISTSDSREGKIILEILNELGLHKIHSASCAFDVKNEESLFGSLCFEVLPFIKYVARQNPLNSERLQKLINSSKSTHVDLIKEWYDE